MPFRVFTLQCNEEGVFDDAELHAFSQEHQVLTCSKDFYMHHNEPKMVIFVEYRPKKAKDFVQKPARMLSVPQVTETGKLQLIPEQKRLYDALRNWRNQKGRQEGKPLMNILTNAQLEDIVRLQPTSVTDFRKISGIGEAKSKKYGTELLVLIHQTPASEGIRGKEASFVTTVLQTPVSQETQVSTRTSGTDDTSTSGTGDTSMLGTENTQRNADET